MKKDIIISLPDGKRIVITSKADPSIVKMFNNVLTSINDEYLKKEKK